MRTPPTPTESTIAAPPSALAAAIPGPRDSALAGTASRVLAPLADAAGTVRITVADTAGTERTVELPTSMLRLVSSVLSEMARGNAVSLIPLHAELSTQEVADILNVSRPYLVGLLEKGDIPFRKVGVQRRVKLRDVMDYKARLDVDRHDALDALARQAQELRLGYDG